MNTPAEVDTKLAEIYGRRHNLVMRRYNLLSAAKNAFREERRVELKAQAEAILPQIAEIDAEMRPIEALYTGWTRAFVVPDGHVHSSMNCSTCYPTTAFGWVTELSGHNEAEIIEAAGSRACTVCYPNAPVDAPAGRNFHATEVAAQAAREERAAKKAAADAKKAANAFGPYRTTGRNRLETLYQAKGFLTDGCEWGWNHPSFSSEDRDAVAGLLAAKLGTTPEKELEAAAKRAANRS